MEQTWTELFYQETDAGKRQALLVQNSEKDNEAVALFREKLWIARYGKRSPKKDIFVGCLMELKYLSEGSAIDFGGKKRKPYFIIRIGVTGLLKQSHNIYLYPQLFPAFTY